MNSGMFSWLWSFVMPAIAVQWLLVEAATRIRPSSRGARLFLGAAVIGLAMVCCPVGERPLARQWAGFSIQPCFPFLAVLFARSVQHSLPRFFCHARRVPQHTRNGHGGNARFFGNEVEADGGRRRGHVFP